MRKAINNASQFVSDSPDREARKARGARIPTSTCESLIVLVRDAAEMQWVKLYICSGGLGGEDSGESALYHPT